MKARTIVIKYTCQESLHKMPDLFIKDLEEAIAIHANNMEELEQIRVKLINCRAVVDNYQARLWADAHGYGPAKERVSYEEQAR